jgi:ABC-type antimicrobial peptide transport system permease subunit
VGVVSDAHLASVLERPTVQLFIPLAQGGAGMLGTANTIVVRSKTNMVDRTAARLREELRLAFPDPAVPSITLMTDAVASEYRPWQIGATLFSAGGLLSLLISIVGVYSLLSYDMTRRIPEIGVRVALGASGVSVAMLVMRGSLTLVGGGVALGIGVALASGRVLAALLYGVSPSDLGTFVQAAALVLFAGTVAGLGPAIRAALLNPVESLRQL